MILLEDSDWEVRTTKVKGRGLFAKKDISAGVIIGDYLGKVIKTIDAPADDHGLYLMYYHDQASIYPNDLTEAGIHLINHSCAPNCGLYIYQGHTLFFALRRIFAFEELTANYMLAPDPFCFPCPHICRCGSRFCTQTMHLTLEGYKKWSIFHQAQADKTKKERIRYGQPLAKLKSYPIQIPDNPNYDLFGSETKEALVVTLTKLPGHNKLRTQIRETGRILNFINLKTKVFAVKDGKVLKFETG